MREAGDVMVEWGRMVNIQGGTVEWFWSVKVEEWDGSVAGDDAGIKWSWGVE